MEEKIDIKNCKKVLKKLCEDLGGNLDSPFCKEVEAHLQICPQCWAYVNSIKNTVHFCQKLVDEDVPQAIHKRLLQCLKLTDSK